MSRMRESLTVLLVNLAALGLIVWKLRDPRATAVQVTPPPSPAPMASQTPALLHVYVSGAVGRPGVVRLGEGARVADAIAAAGGLAVEADSVAVNLAAPVADGWHLHIPAEAEAMDRAAVAAAPNPAPQMPAAAAGGAASGGLAGGVVVDTGRGPAAPGAGTQALDLNEATAVELETLPGVGPALATRILEYRQSHGRFSSVDELLAVSGIGEKTLERLRGSVTVR